MTIFYEEYGVQTSKLSAEDHSWTVQAACGDRGNLMFPVSFTDSSIEAAKAVCSGCPVVAQCLEAALENGEQHGVWGGTTPPERWQMLRRQNPKMPKWSSLK